MDKILRTENLCVHFGGIIATNDVNLSIQRGQIHALIGPNGAGKSTLFNLITGHIKPTSGKVLFKEQEITNKPIHAICKMGLARSFQLINIYPALTVAESIEMSLLSQRNLAGKVFGSARSRVRGEIDRILEMVGLTDKRDLSAKLLPHGDKKRLELGITLGNQPELLLMDEPTAGMAQDERWATVDLIKQLVTHQNLTVFFTEHDMDMVFDIADRISVLHQGKIICEGLPREIVENLEVRKCYLGE